MRIYVTVLNSCFETHTQFSLFSLYNSVQMFMLCKSVISIKSVGLEFAAKGNRIRYGASLFCYVTRKTY
jgi:hypothetical protein